MKTNLTLMSFFIGLSYFSNAQLTQPTNQMRVDTNSHVQQTDTGTIKATVIPTIALKYTKKKDTIRSPFAIGFLPLLTPNRFASICLINDVQFNILAGYSNGIRAAEIGGLMNIVSGNVKWFQLAGLGNSVKDTVKGAQIAGLFNTTGKTTTGIQVGGLFNYATTFNGAQIGGLVNVTKKNTAGLQVGGLANYSDSVKGLQIAGLTNTAAKQVDGGQIAGLVNTAQTVNGSQLAGLINASKITNGFQLAGLVNYTQKLNGVQLSFFNYADSCSGIPLGFFSYVKKGYHKIEFTVDELFLTTIGFRVGVDKLHNIFFTGIKLSDAPVLWTYGYGLGSTSAITNKFNLTCDVTSQQLQTTTNNRNIRLNLLNKLFFGFEYQAFPKFSMTLGPTYDVTVSDITSKDYAAVYSKVAPYSFYNQNHGDFNIKMWVGAKIALKFY